MKRQLTIVLVGLLVSVTVFGQARDSLDTGAPKMTVTGLVYDINRSVIPFSNVVARNLAGKEYQATTNAEGIYKIDLPPGFYKIEANASGFCPRRIDQFRVGSSSPNKWPLDFPLEISQSDRPCRQGTMIKKQRPTRKPEGFRSIAE